jgi:hypothetical protein
MSSYELSTTRKRPANVRGMGARALVYIAAAAARMAALELDASSLAARSGPFQTACPARTPQKKRATTRL